MSASIDRLRQIAAAWHRAVHVDSSMIPVHICDLDAVLADVSAERTRADAAEAECDYWRTQATMAASSVDAVRALGSRLIPGGTGCAVDPERVVAAAEGLRREAALAEMERDTLRGLTDAMRADNVRLRAIVEGRTVPPTDAEIAAHERAGGRWRCALVHLRGGHDWMDDDDARAKVRLSAPGTWRWWPLDASGRPCPWPTALDAGEGR